jgi:hypothetical protein
LASARVAANAAIRSAAFGHAHAAAAAAGGRLDEHRIAHVAGDPLRLGVAAQRVLGARHDRHAKRAHGALGGDLVAHHADVLGRRPDEGEAVLDHHLGEVGVLGQEADAGMDRIGAGDRRGRQDRRHVEIAAARRRRADAHALVGQPHVHGVGVRGRVHGDRLDAELAARTVDAQRDLAAVGYEDFFEHEGERAAPYSMIINASPNSTGWPS